MSAGKNISSERTYFHRHLFFARKILREYSGSEPFHLYLKRYFNQNKQHGSRDRREISSLCFDYFRLGKAPKPEIEPEKQLLLGQFLTRSESSPILYEAAPEWNERIGQPVEEKLAFVSEWIEADQLFPFQHLLTHSIDRQKFNLSFLTQPLTFLRVRPGKERKVRKALETSHVPFDVVWADCIALAPSTPVATLLKLNSDVVVQDASSQRTGEFLKQLENHQLKVWDCCAASGGKSILAIDLLKSPKLTVTDTRASILRNLDKRFQQAGIDKYERLVVDLSCHQPFPANTFDVILADVPCSGSGTWARTPEQLRFFKEEQVQEYVQLQRKICSNAMLSLKKGGVFLYITCSVFEQENEGNVQWLQSQGLQLVNQAYFKGYHMRADTLYAALLKPNLT